MNHQKRRFPESAFFVLFAWTIMALLIWNFRDIQLDDAYITYRYARNLSQGLGFSYNPPQLVLGTTTPLYTLILALFAWLGADIPSTGLMISGAGLGMVAWVLISFGGREGNPFETFLTAGLFILLPGSYIILGMETAFYTALVYLGFYFLAQRKFTTAVILASAATLTRYDGIVAAGYVLLAEWVFTRSFPLKNGFFYVGLMAPWAFYAMLTFGSILPSTFFAKTGELGTNVFIDNLGPQVMELLGFVQVGLQGGYIASISMLAIFVWSWFIGGNTFERSAVAWALLYLAAYGVLGIRYAFHWYYFPIIPAFLISLRVNMNWLQGRFNKIFRGRLRQTIMVGRFPLLLIVLPMLTLAIMGTIVLDQKKERLASLGGRNIVYPLAAEWVCSHSNQEAAILTPEIGLIGWNCDRQIIDPYGLVTPEMIPYIRSGDRLTGEAGLHPDFIIIPNIGLEETQPEVPGSEVFQDVYRPVKVITDDRYPYQLVIFSKVP